MGSFSEEEKDFLRSTLHLKKDYWFQLKNFSQSLLTFNFGISEIKQESINALIWQHFKTNFYLFLALFTSTILIGSFFLWLFVTYKKNFFIQKIKNIYFYFTTIPAFLLAPLFIYFLCYKWSIFSLGGSIFLPTLPLTITFSAYFVSMVLKDLEAERKKDYYKFHQGVGIFGKNLFFLLLKNISVRMINILTLQSLSVLTGLAVIEKIFDIPGLGLLLLEALNTRDFPLLQACLIFNLIFIYFLLGVSHVIQKNLHPEFK